MNLLFPALRIERARQKNYFLISMCWQRTPFFIFELPETQVVSYPRQRGWSFISHDQRFACL